MVPLVVVYLGEGWDLNRRNDRDDIFIWVAFRNLECKVWNVEAWTNISLVTRLWNLLVLK